ncbi:hypothetical protein SDJN03_27575, partial [Cucurbita argyrosperma subsp. sororia]
MPSGLLRHWHGGCIIDFTLMMLETNKPLKDINHILIRLFIRGIPGRSFGNCECPNFLYDPIFGLVLIAKVRTRKPCLASKTTRIEDCISHHIDGIRTMAVQL